MTPEQVTVFLNTWRADGKIKAKETAEEKQTADNAQAIINNWRFQNFNQKKSKHNTHGKK